MLANTRFSARMPGALPFVSALAASLVLALTPACSPSATQRPSQAPTGAGSPAATSPSAPAPPPSPEAAAKVDELVARHLAARGGLEKIRALKSLRLTGVLRFGDEDFAIDSIHGMVQKRPASI